MSNFRREFPLVFLLFLFAVKCETAFNEFTTDIDQCKDVCSDSFFLLPKTNDAQNICQRGCRFFNIIYLKDDHDLNITKEECYLSCAEAYDVSDPKAACNTGCKAMSKKKESEFPNLMVFIEQENPKTIMILEPELEILESDLISDPLIQSQIEIGYNIEYKIPETKIQTMPIEDFEIVENSPTGDWLDCASRNSGIPKWILCSAILSAILVALWLSITSERKVIGDELDDSLVKNEVECEAEALPPKKPLGEGEIQFSTPPKYTIETEKV